jgi:AcrR family transcriptional regulator
MCAARAKTPKNRSRRKPRRAPLTPERVLGEALRLVDEQGLDALSMRTLARALKVEAMSLYNHVAGKDQLLDGLVELVVAELELPARGGDWRAAMRSRALTAHAVLMRHPWATMLLVSRLNVGPNMLRYTDATIGCLTAAGFSYPLADHAWTAVDAYVYGFTLQKRNFPLDPTQYAAAAKQFLPLLPPGQLLHLRGLSEEVIAGRHDGVHHLEQGLDLLLDGFARLRGQEGDGERAPAASR